MILSPEEISSFLYCPMLYYKKRINKLYSNLNNFEKLIKKSIIKAEEYTLLKQSPINTRKIISAWDDIWWKIVKNNNIPFDKAQKISLKAAEKFITYCSLEISNYKYLTIGVDINSQKNIEGNILTGHADIIKVDLTNKSKQTLLINISNLDYSRREAAFDMAIRANAYTFYSGKNETITNINLNIAENNKNISINISTFDGKELHEIGKAIVSASNMIKNNVKYMNHLHCKECKLCPI